MENLFKLLRTRSDWLYFVGDFSGLWKKLWKTLWKNENHINLQTEKPGIFKPGFSMEGTGDAYPSNPSSMATSTPAPRSPLRKASGGGAVKVTCAPVRGWVKAIRQAWSISRGTHTPFG